MHDRLRYLPNVATLRYDQGLCIGCGMCLEVCPHQVFIPNDGKVAAGDIDACMECGACMVNCPTAAIQVKTGVGCAAAVINALLGREGDCTCSLVETPERGQTNKGGCC